MGTQNLTGNRGAQLAKQDGDQDQDLWLPWARGVHWWGQGQHQPCPGDVMRTRLADTIPMGKDLVVQAIGSLRDAVSVRCWGLREVWLGRQKSKGGGVVSEIPRTKKVISGK